MQSVEIHGMKQVRKAFERLLEMVRQAKADGFEAAGEYFLEDVQNLTGGSGHAAGAHEYQVSSGNGCVAVRAKKETCPGGTAVGYITNALENGHVQVPGEYVPALGAVFRAIGRQANICIKSPGGARVPGWRKRPSDGSDRPYFRNLENNFRSCCTASCKKEDIVDYS